MHRSYAESRSGFDAFSAKEIRRRHSLSPGRLQFDQPEPSGSALDYWIRLDADDRAERTASAFFDLTNYAPGMSTTVSSGALPGVTVKPSASTSVGPARILETY